MAHTTPSPRLTPPPPPPPYHTLQPTISHSTNGKTWGLERTIACLLWEPARPKGGHKKVSIKKKKKEANGRKVAVKHLPHSRKHRSDDDRGTIRQAS